jgi:hypothetical protein
MVVSSSSAGGSSSVIGSGAGASKGAGRAGGAGGLWAKGTLLGGIGKRSRVVEKKDATRLC